MLCNGDHLKLLIAFGHNLFIFGIEPITFSFVNIVYGLRVKLFIVDRRTIDRTGYGDDDITSAAGKCRSVNLVIARAGE